MLTEDAIAGVRLRVLHGIGPSAEPVRTATVTERVVSHGGRKAVGPVAGHSRYNPLADARGSDCSFQVRSLERDHAAPHAKP